MPMHIAQAAAKTGNQQVMRIQAKSLVRVRGQIAKLQASIAQLKGVSTQMTVRGDTNYYHSSALFVL